MTINMNTKTVIMKQNIFKQLISACSHPLALAALLAGGLSVACKEDSTMLPEGRYPVIPTAVIQAIPLGSGTEAWAGEEQIAVQSVSFQDGGVTETSTYVTAADGIMTSSDPIWWKHSGEKKKVSAWYCGDGSTAEDGANVSAVPSAWTVQADQSGDGYDASRLLYAPVRETSFAPSRIVPLTFYHQPAKIVMNVNKGGTVTSANQITSIKIKDMALSGSWSAPVAEGETVGAWTVDGNAEKTDIVFHKLDSPEGSALASFAGYAVPQEMAGKTVTVQTDENKEVAAVIDANDEALVAGDAKTYMLTINEGGSPELVVEALKLAVEFTAEDLKLGDYFYNDGTVSDGGLRGIYTNGSLKMEPQKPSPVAGKRVVGIVFQTDPNRMGNAEKETLGGECSGLVMSLKNAATDVIWGPQTDESSLTNTGKHSDIYNDISGYANYTALCAAHPEDIDDYPAFKAVMDYNETCPVPENTTGWFLPSGGQMWDIMQILGDCTALADPATQTDSGTGWQIEFKGLDGYINKLNAWMESVVSGNKDLFVSGKYILTSTERTDANAWYWIMNDAVMYLQGGGKNQQFTVRPVLAFKWIDPDEPLDPVGPKDPEESEDPTDPEAPTE